MKKLTKALAIVFSATMLVSTAACNVEALDPNTITVKVFNGGGGTEWIQKVAAEYNKTATTYKVALAYEKITADAIFKEIELGNPSADCYFTSDAAFQAGIYRDYYEDLSDLLDRVVDNTGKTIQQKMLHYSDWQKLSSKYGEGMYMLPYLDAFTGLVYDHDLFVSKGWLQYADVSDKAALTAQGYTFEEVPEGTATRLYFVSADGKTNYQDGDVLLKAGKDGKFGTYDDGQPQTEAEFAAMVKSISGGADSAKPFLYNGVHDHYVNQIAQGVMAQYMGAAAYHQAFAFDSGDATIKMHDSTEKQIDLATNGYEMYKSEGVYQALKFTDTYFNNPAYLDAKCTDITGFTHTDAQNRFVLEMKKANDGSHTQYPTMLVEGAWWMNEASVMIDQVADKSPLRAKDKVDFRYMLLPKINGQYGMDGNGNGTFFSGSDNGGIVVRKQTDPNKLVAIKEFIAMTMTDEVLRDYTVSTGIIRPFDYTLTDAELAQMTPFARNAWDIYHDTANITIERYAVLYNTQPIVFAGKIGANSYIYMETDGVYNNSYVRALRSAGGLSNLWTDVGHTAATWASAVQAAKAQGFYK